MNTEWTRMEEGILKSYYGRVPTDELFGMLPNRSSGAIMTRAQTLRLKIRPKQDQTIMPTTNTPTSTTLEQLEAEVALKRAQLGVDEAARALDIFDELMVTNFLPTSDINDFIKTNSAKRSKMVAALSRAKLKLVMARIAQKS